MKGSDERAAPCLPHTCLPRTLSPSLAVREGPHPEFCNSISHVSLPTDLPTTSLVAGLEGPRGPSPLPPTHLRLCRQSRPLLQPPSAEPPARHGICGVVVGGGFRRRGCSPAHLLLPALDRFPSPMSSAPSPPPSPCLLSLGSLLRASAVHLALFFLTLRECAPACLHPTSRRSLPQPPEERRVSGS